MSLGADWKVPEKLIIRRVPIGRLLFKIEENVLTNWRSRYSKYSVVLKFFSLLPERELYCRMCGAKPLCFAYVSGNSGGYVLIGEDNLLFTRDHVIPLALARDSRDMQVFENCQVLCLRCNEEKDTTYSLDDYERNKRYIRILLTKRLLRRIRRHYEDSLLKGSSINTRKRILHAIRSFKDNIRILERELEAKSY